MGKVTNNLFKIVLGIAGISTFTACYGIGPRDYLTLVPFPVAGKVTDENGAPIKGVKVTRYGTELATSSEDGSFRTELLIGYSQPDTVQLHFKDAAHGERVQEVKLWSEEELNVVLKSGD